MKFDNLEEAQMRLKGTVIALGNEPIYINEIRVENTEATDYTLFYKPIPHKYSKMVPISISDPRLGTKLKLGYVNTKEGTLWVNRYPVRKYKIGLNQENVIIKSVPDTWCDGRSWGTVLDSGGLPNTAKNIFPCPEEAIEVIAKLEEQGLIPNCCAFQRDLVMKKDGLREDYVLMHRNRAVGFGSGKGEWSLIEDYHYLYEDLNERGVRCRKVG